MQNRIGLKLVVFVLLVSGFGGDALAQRRNPPAPARITVSPETTLRLEAFEKVWTTIRDFYFDPTYNKLNWQSIRTEFEPRIRRSKSDDEAHKLLEEMVGRLKVSHLAIVPPDVYEAIETAKDAAKEREEQRAKLIAERDPTEQPAEDEDELDDALAQYGIGIDLRVLADKFVITRVEVGSPAEKSGLRLGFVIDSINGVSLNTLLSLVRTNYPNDDRVVRYLPLELIRDFINGEKGSSVEIGYQDAADKILITTINRELLSAETVDFGEFLPESRMQFVTRSISDDIGYIRFDNFSLPVIKRFCDAITELRDKKGIIIDLRGNTGGVMGVSMGLAGMLSDKPLDLGTSIYRYHSEPMASLPKAKNYRGNIIVLVDNLSVSAAEIFASGLQEGKRAMIVGETSAGETLPSASVELATGATFLYPIANYRTPSGRFLEGTGVRPDRAIKLDRSSLLAGKDAQLDAAVAALGEARATAPAPTELAKAPERFTIQAGPPPPAPPPPAAKKLPVLGTVTVTAPPPPAEAPKVIEPKAAEMMTAFGKLAGGVEAFDKIDSYEMKGAVQIFSMGTSHVFEYSIFRIGKEKYSEILRSPALGEIKDIRDGKTIHIKGDLGIDSKNPYAFAIDQMDIFGTLKRAMRTDHYKKLLYLGIFDREGRKVHLIDGETKEGLTVALYFDTETKMLSGFEGPTGGVEFGDFRTSGELSVPYRVRMRSVLDIEFEEIKLNVKIDPSVFVHKERCYDRPN
jgi:Periplasmic protease